MLRKTFAIRLQSLFFVLCARFLIGVVVVFPSYCLFVALKVWLFLFFLCLFFEISPRSTSHTHISTHFQGPDGVIVHKANGSVVIGTYGEGMQPADCNTAIGKMVEYLNSTGS